MLGRYVIIKMSIRLVFSVLRKNVYIVKLVNPGFCNIFSFPKLFKYFLFSFLQNYSNTIMGYYISNIGPGCYICSRPKHFRPDLETPKRKEKKKKRKVLQWKKRAIFQLNVFMNKIKVLVPILVLICLTFNCYK